RSLETGSATLESSLTLWERGEELAARCQQILDGARERLDQVTSRGGSGPTDDRATPGSSDVATEVDA
nr:exodeoxyribonuclease VII small subunit [Actinomycetales bacterium]